MYRAAVLALIVVTLLCAMSLASFGQDRPRRVGPPQTPPSVAPGTPAAPPDSAGNGGDDTVSLEGALIEVPVVVSDRSGHYVPQLRQQDFRVLEDGVEQQIVFFSDQRVPIHVALVMDTSGSTRDTIDEIQQAAVEFIDQLLPGDQVLVVSFADQVVVEQEFTNDRGRLRQAITRTRANGSTKLYEAVYLTVAERLRHVEGRKAMIILSDGEDTSSKDVTADEAIDVCSESDVTAYGIRYPESDGVNIYTGPGNWPLPPTWPQPRRGRPRINIPGLPWPLVPLASAFADPQFGGHRPGRAQLPGMGHDSFMETITSDTGGTLVYADQVADVRGLLGQIAEELRHVYLIGYAPSNPLANGGHRRITVQVPRRPDLAVRHRLGYQAEAYKSAAAGA